MELSLDNLLSKCLHSYTQNPNESFNQIIWEKCPKTHFVSKSVLELSISFNGGYVLHKETFQQIGFHCEKYFLLGAIKKDKNCVIHMERKEKEVTKSRRKKLRGIRKEFNKDDSYVSGNF